MRIISLILGFLAIPFRAINSFYRRYVVVLLLRQTSPISLLEGEPGTIGQVILHIPVNLPSLEILCDFCQRLAKRSRRAAETHRCSVSSLRITPSSNLCRIFNSPPIPLLC
jgi:hypothetical protein